MYINKLYLRAFGKFIYKRIYLNKKFNIVYGENEAGKSTIHNFIESIFYGFDPDDKGSELCNKYKPWNNDLYRGSINVDGFHKNKYLITKDFLLNTTKVFNKDVEDNDSINMEEDFGCPGEYFFNMNKTSFRNTVSIKQLGNKTEKELATEVKNKIINLSKSKDESISIEKIIERLNSFKEEAGSEYNPKTLLGQYSIRLKELEKTKENTLNANRQTMFLGMEKKKINSRIKDLELNIENLNKELDIYELIIDKNKYFKALPIKEELDNLNSLLSNYTEEEKTQIISKKDYQEAYSLVEFLNKMQNERDILRTKRNNAEDELSKLQQDISNNISDSFDMIKINSDFKIYIENIDKIKNMQNKIMNGEGSIKSYNLDEINSFVHNYELIDSNNNEVNIIKLLVNNRNYDVINGFIHFQKIKGAFSFISGILFLALAGVAAYGAYYFSIPEYYIGIVSLVPSFVLLNLWTKSKNRIINSKKEIDSLDCEQLDYNNKIDELVKTNEEIIKNMGIIDLEELEDNYKKNIELKMIAEEKIKLLNYDKSEMDDIVEQNKDLEKNLLNDLKILSIEAISEENIKLTNDIFNRKDLVKQDIITYKDLISEINYNISKSDKEIEFEKKRLHIILNSNNMSDFDEFKKSIERYEKILELNHKKNYCEDSLSDLLQETSIEELKNKTKHINIVDMKEIDKKEQLIKIFRLNEEKNQLTKSINDINEEIEEIEDSVRNLAEIEEEIDFYQNKICLFNEKIQIAKIASEKIIEISDSIKGDFMPLLRKSISENFAYITSGKYKEVVLDENMNITVVSDEKDSNIDIESLSGGALDQLYLSLRISLSNILSGNQNIPIILDDSFVQYDSNRLKKSIEMLSRESERRQIILFTCQEREIEYAKQMNVKFNLIKL